MSGDGVGYERAWRTVLGDDTAKIYYLLCTVWGRRASKPHPVSRALLRLHDWAFCNALPEVRIDLYL